MLHRRLAWKGEALWIYRAARVVCRRVPALLARQLRQVPAPLHRAHPQDRCRPAVPKAQAAAGPWPDPAALTISNSIAPPGNGCARHRSSGHTALPASPFLIAARRLFLFMQTPELPDWVGCVSSAMCGNVIATGLYNNSVCVYDHEDGASADAESMNVVSLLCVVLRPTPSSRSLQPPAL